MSLTTETTTLKGTVQEVLPVVTMPTEQAQKHYEEGIKPTKGGEVTDAEIIVEAIDKMRWTLGFQNLVIVGFLGWIAGRRR